MFLIVSAPEFLILYQPFLESVHLFILRDCLRGSTIYPIVDFRTINSLAALNFALES